MSNTLFEFILSKLINVRRGPDGSATAQCPVCASEGRDHQKNHLRVWPSTAFSCAAHQHERGGEHNRSIRAAIRGGEVGNGYDLLMIDAEYIDTDPKLDLPHVYPEGALTRLISDHSYWVNRGIKESVLVRIGGGVASIDEKSKLSGRYVLPCRDTQGRIIGWAGRVLDDNSFGPRWKILGRKAHFLFPPVSISDSQMRAKSEIILVEGQGCALALMSAGIENVICLFGVKLSGKIIGHIVSLAPRHVIIATNNEASGIGNRAAEEIKGLLSSFVLPEHIEIRLPIAKDFADMTEDQIKEWYIPTISSEAEAEIKELTKTEDPKSL